MRNSSAHLPADWHHFELWQVVVVEVKREFAIGGDGQRGRVPVVAVLAECRHPGPQLVEGVRDFVCRGEGALLPVGEAVPAGFFGEEGDGQVRIGGLNPAVFSLLYTPWAMVW